MTQACTICGETNNSHWYTGGAVRSHWKSDKVWSVSRCTACHHCFMAPYPSDEILAEYYAKGYVPFGFANGTTAHVDELVARAHESGKYRHVAIKPGMKVLDVGCGGGSFLYVCEKLGATVQGVEPSSEGVATCTKNGIPVFEGYLTEFLAQNSQSFDLITANHVVEHHPDPVLLLKEMRSLLTPDGKVWFSVPNAGCITSRMLKSDWHSSDLPVHLQHFTLQSIERLLDLAGFENVNISTESENSLPAGVANMLRKRAYIPGRLTKAVLGKTLLKSGWLGKKMDDAGNGEAILVEAS